MPYEDAWLPRDLFEFPPEMLWLSHCKDGPLPLASVQAMQAIVRTELRPWELRWNEDFLDVLTSLRSAGAALLGVSADDVSITQCTSTGLETVAGGYPWQDGDEVVIPVGEFPSNRLPWLALAGRGVSCREVPLWPGQSASPPALPDAAIAPEQALLDAITPRTRVVAVSWVRYQDGVRLDLARLGGGCRERGVHLVVDGIQGAGTMVASFDGVSAFATGGHKGLLGPQGQGLLWTDPAFRQRLMPTGTWLSAPQAFSQSGIQDEAASPWATDGRRLEAGSPSIMSCAALDASIRVLIAHGGAASLKAHIANLQQALLARLAAHPAWEGEARRLRGLLDAERLGSTLSFAVPEPRCENLLRAGAVQGISASSREGYLRVAFHGWHAMADVARCADWLASA